MKKSLIKRAMALAISLIMVIGLMPMNAAAVTTSVPGAEGHILDSILSYTWGDSHILVYATPGAYDPYQNHFYEDHDTYACIFYPKCADEYEPYGHYGGDLWHFAGYETYYKGSHLGLGVIKVEKENPTFDHGNIKYFASSSGPMSNGRGNAYILINKESTYEGTYYISFIYEPIVTVNAGDGVTPTVLNAVNRGENRYSIKYGNTITVNYTVADNYIVTNVHGNLRYDLKEGVNTVSGKITEPGSINISSRLKQMNVNFNANGGEGTMAAQTFEHSVAQALTANNFTKTGYIFAGWNTKADGSGTGYADKESVSFAPENDGDSIILYAQWTKCNDHDWENGECTKCGTLCRHLGGEATCTEQATCEVCGEKYGSRAKHTFFYSRVSNRIIETCIEGCRPTAYAALVLDTNVSTVYTGSAIEALKVVYSDNWQGGNLDIDYSDNVNVGTASGSVSIGGETATQTFAITAAAMTNVSAQGYSGTYDGQAHGITVNAPEGATVSYKVGDGAYSAENPAFTNAGTYTVAYKVSMANHTDVEGTAEVTINKAPLTVMAKDNSIKYGETANNSGVTYSGFVSSETESVLGGVLDFDYTYSIGDNIGTYELTPKGLTSNNYIISFEKGTLTVEQKELTITWGNTSLVYNKAEQLPEYAAAGILSGDDVQFIVTGAAKNAATLPYTAVITGITGDDAGNYKLPNNLSVEFTISRAKPNIGTVSVSETVYDTTMPKDVVLVRTNTEVPGRLSIEKVGDFMRADKTEYFWEFVPTDVDNYEAIYGYVQIDVVDTKAPNTIISIDEHQWTLWHTVTFGLFYNENKVVTIACADNENGSGIKETLYYIADKDMTVEELQTVQWTAYTEAFEIDPDGEYVIYAKVVDNDGNITIINSDGVVLDKTAPVLAGISSGEAYYGDTVFKALDDYLDVLKVDGVDVTAELNGDNEYKIIADNAEHTVTAIDKAGNVTEYKITVYKNYTVTYKADGETVSTETVGHDKDATAPAIPEKEGYTKTAPVWNKDGKNITADTEINAVYTINEYTITFMNENGVHKTLTVKHGEKVEMPEAPAKEGYAVKWDTIIDVATGDVTVNAVYTKNPAPSDTQPPQTGDNSKLWLWFVLLLVSGAGIFGITLNERKRKAASKR